MSRGRSARPRLPPTASTTRSSSARSLRHCLAESNAGSNGGTVIVGARLGALLHRRNSADDSRRARLESAITGRQPDGGRSLDGGQQWRPARRRARARGAGRDRDDPRRGPCATRDARVLGRSGEPASPSRARPASADRSCTAPAELDLHSPPSCFGSSATPTRPTSTAASRDGFGPGIQSSAPSELDRTRTATTETTRSQRP